MSYADPWCAAFPSAVAAKCGLLGTILPECGCDPMIELYKARGQWVESDDYVPQPGDLVMYNWQAAAGEDRGSADHVGIVTEVKDGWIIALEGNISDEVGYRQIETGHKYIRGFCCPAFNAEIEPESSPDTAPEENCGYFTPAPMRVLSFGMTGPDVGSMQRLLIGKGYSCGRWRDDCDFGQDTLRDLKAFQTATGLYASGELDPDTFSALWR